MRLGVSVSIRSGLDKRRLSSRAGDVQRDSGLVFSRCLFGVYMKIYHLPVVAIQHLSPHSTERRYCNLYGLIPSRT